MSENAFQYFINQKRNIAVISFVGNPVKGDIELLSKCYDEIGNLPCKFIVFNMTGVTEIAPELDPAFVRMQVFVRDSVRELVVCGLNAALKKRLEDAGIIRTYETANSLVEALQRIVSTGGTK